MAKTLGKTLKAARETAGLAQWDVAIKAFGDASYQSLISRWEADLVEPSLKNLRKLAPVLSLSLGDFTDVSSETLEEATPHPVRPASAEALAQEQPA